MSDSVQPHSRQVTRLRCPWDSPGKNTGVGCHFLLQCTKVKSESEVVQLCLTLRPHGLQPTRLLHPWDFPGKSTGMGCHCLLMLAPGDCINCSVTTSCPTLCNPMNCSTPGLPAEKAMAPHSSTIAWKIPWAEQPGRLQSMGSLGVGHD